MIAERDDLQLKLQRSIENETAKSEELSRAQESADNRLTEVQNLKAQLQKASIEHESVKLSLQQTAARREAELAEARKQAKVQAANDSHEISTLKAQLKALKKADDGEWIILPVEE